MDRKWKKGIRNKNVIDTETNKDIRKNTDNKNIINKKRIKMDLNKDMNWDNKTKNKYNYKI